MVCTISSFVHVLASVPPRKTSEEGTVALVQEVPDPRGVVWPHHAGAQTGAPGPESHPTASGRVWKEPE